MSSKKLPDTALVQAYMDQLEHPLKDVLQALRTIIKNAYPNISERIKWNAPSYYYQEDIVTFGPPARKMDEILLVFHHPSVVKIASAILEGNYKDRRLATFKSMEEVEAGREELGRILRGIIVEIEIGR